MGSISWLCLPADTEIEPWWNIQGYAGLDFSLNQLFSGSLFWCLRGHQWSVDYRMGDVASEMSTGNPLNVCLGQQSQRRSHIPKS